MSRSAHLSIHTLTPFPLHLPNRDDMGFAKTVTMGGSIRTRISSQCLKRSWRTYDGVGGFLDLFSDDQFSIRSRHIFNRNVLDGLIAKGIDAHTAASAIQPLLKHLTGGKDKKGDEDPDSDGNKVKKGKKGKKNGADASDKTADDKTAASADTTIDLKTEQVLVLGRREIEFLVDYLASYVKSGAKIEDMFEKKFVKDSKKKLENIIRCTNATIDVAMFGRMVTGESLAQMGAAASVSHAFTVHDAQQIPEFFVAVDDLDSDGSAMMGNTELGFGIYYQFTSVNIPLLIQNLGGDRELAGRSIEALINTIAFSSPSGKRTSTGYNSGAAVMAVQAGRRQPLSLANAFMTPIDPAGVLSDSIAAMNRLMVSQNKNKGHAPVAACMIESDDIYNQSSPLEGFGERCSVEGLASWSKANSLSLIP